MAKGRALAIPAQRTTDVRGHISPIAYDTITGEYKSTFAARSLEAFADVVPIFCGQAPAIAPTSASPPGGNPTHNRRPMTAAGRARLAAGQKARWDKIRAEKLAAGKTATAPATSTKHRTRKAPKTMGATG